MYNDVTFIKARTETIGLELRSRVDNLWVQSSQEFARIQQQLNILLEDRDSVPRGWSNLNQEFRSPWPQSDQFGYVIQHGNWDGLIPAVNVLVSLNENLVSNSSPQTLLFNQLIGNLADGYDQHSGHFRCPISGVYTFNLGLSVAQGTGVQVCMVFSSRCCSLKGWGFTSFFQWLSPSFLQGTLLHDGTALLHLPLQETGQLYSAGLSIQCREGQGVWVEITHPASDTPVQLNSDCYLSGALVSSLQWEGRLNFRQHGPYWIADRCNGTTLDTGCQGAMVKHLCGSEGWGCSITGLM